MPVHGRFWLHIGPFGRSNMNDRCCERGFIDIRGWSLFCSAFTLGVTIINSVVADKLKQRRINMRGSYSVEYRR
jgi:hypothetical protein